MKRLLYDLHNEVLEAAEIRINTECSLTTREGVSRRAETAARTASSLTTREGVSAGATGTQWGGGFPHYT